MDSTIRLNQRASEADPEEPGAVLRGLLELRRTNSTQWKDMVLAILEDEVAFSRISASLQDILCEDIPLVANESIAYCPSAKKKRCIKLLQESSKGIGLGGVFSSIGEYKVRVTPMSDYFFMGKFSSNTAHENYILFAETARPLEENRVLSSRDALRVAVQYPVIVNGSEHRVTFPDDSKAFQLMEIQADLLDQWLGYKARWLVLSRLFGEGDCVGAINYECSYACHQRRERILVRHKQGR